MSSPNPETVRRLAFIRYLYTTGVAQSRSPEPVSPVSVLTFHDAVELFLQLASEHLNAGGKQPQFMEYWEILEAKLSTELSQKESMRRLNKARVALKHAGTFPSQLDIEAFRATVTAFFEENTPAIFGTPLSEVSLAEFVQPIEAREKLKAAQSEKNAGHFGEAVTLASVAFELMVYDYEKKKRNVYGRSPFYFGESFSFLSSSMMDIGRGFSADRSARKLGEFIDKVGKSIESVAAAIKVLALGIDYRKYSRFKMLGPSIFRTASGELVVQPRSISATDMDAQFCVDFVIESALRLRDFDYELGEH
jgi:hypothetical protein